MNLLKKKSIYNNKIIYYKDFQFYLMSMDMKIETLEFSITPSEMKHENLQNFLSLIILFMMALLKKFSKLSMNYNHQK